MKELQELKEIIGGYAENLFLDTTYNMVDGKLIRHTKVGDKVDSRKPVRTAGVYKIYADHFDCALPYTKYYIVNTENGLVYVIPEVVTIWNTGALKEITENIKAGRNLQKVVISDEEKEYFKNLVEYFKEEK